VGYALHAVATDDARLPWHRVLNARGAISLRAEGPGGSVLQRLRLEREGVRFDGRGRVDLDAVRWRPRGLERARRAGRAGDVD
jgi:methylated-DNA-protein-cysteine methyltransferase-like protein